MEKERKNACPTGKCGWNYSNSSGGVPSFASYIFGFAVKFLRAAAAAAVATHEERASEGDGGHRPLELIVNSK